MKNDGKQRKQKKQLVITLTVLSVCLIGAILFIAQQFMELNSSVTYERFVFISQIAEQMKKNVMNSGKSHAENIWDFAVILDEVSPKTFEQVQALFPEYTGTETGNQLFFLTSGCELYGIDGRKRWVSLPYDDYLLDVLSGATTADFIRIGMEQEFMVYSALLPSPVEIDGCEVTAILFGWDSSEYRATLSSRLFEAKSSSLLVGRQGNIAVYPEAEDSESYGYNIYSYLEKQGMTENNLEKIRKLVTETEDRTILCEVNGNRWLFSVANYSEQYCVFIMLPIQITSANTYQSLYGLLAGVVVSFIMLGLMVGAILLSAVLRQREQRELEMQTALLMKSAQAKNEFLAKMSHDIRTPLSGIIGMNYIASIKIPPECTEAADCLDKVNVAATYLLGILNDILDMSKIESGELRLSIGTFSLDALKTELESLMLFQIEKKGLRFFIDAPAEIQYDYVGDALRIKQILVNLLSNAVKFTEQGSVTLTICVQPASAEADKVTFFVRDTGKGIAKEYIEHIFTPFSQEDDSVANKYGGSGLGLSIVKSFVEMMGGDISVASEVGKGSEFTVTLLLEKVQRAAKPEELPPPEAVRGFSGKRILLCEDNDLNAEIAEVILGQFDLMVDRAESGKRGVELFEQSAPNYYSMIFMDVRMPQMDGYEATRAIRALKRSDARQVPICALSANAFSDDIKKSMEVGMNAHLAKPLDVALLADVLAQYLG